VRYTLTVCPDDAAGWVSSAIWQEGEKNSKLAAYFAARDPRRRRTYIGATTVVTSWDSRESSQWSGVAIFKGTEREFIVISW
jgi:hypothetical protein